MKLEQINKKRFAITKDNYRIIIKNKHIPIFLMMLQSHWNDFTSDNQFGKHEITKCKDNTIISKINSSTPVYAMTNKEDYTRLCSVSKQEQYQYIEINEDDVSNLIVMIADYFLSMGY